jgi:hypothetical protein
MATLKKNSKILIIPILLIVLALACNLPRGGIQESYGAEVSAPVGVDGGEIQGPNGMQLVIPAGAVEGTTEIKIAEVPSQPEPQPGFESGSGAYQVEVPPGTDFLLPVEVILPLIDGRPEMDYGVYRWDGGQWSYLGGEVDGDEIHVYVDHFSVLQSWGSINLHTRPVMFVNYGGDPAWIFAWEWDTNETTRLNMPAAFVMRRGLFGKDPTWWFQMYPMGTIYSWCVQWEQWTEPYWDLHGGGFVSEYINTYNFIFSSPVTISKESPQGDYMDMVRVEFSTGGGQQGTCGYPPGQVPKTAAPTAGMTPTTGTMTETPGPVTVTPGPATETAAILPTGTLTPSTGNLTPQESTNNGTFLYHSACTFSDGDSDSEEFTLSFKFSDDGVALTDHEFGDTVSYAKIMPNIYENSDDDLFSRITFTDIGFDYYGEGFSLTGDCVVTRK